MNESSATPIKGVNREETIRLSLSSNKLEAKSGSREEVGCIIVSKSKYDHHLLGSHSGT